MGRHALFVVLLLSSLLFGAIPSWAQPPVGGISWGPPAGSPCSGFQEWRLSYQNVPSGCEIRVSWYTGLTLEGVPFTTVSTGMTPVNMIATGGPVIGAWPASYRVVIEYRCPIPEGGWTAWQQLYTNNSVDGYPPLSMSAVDVNSWQPNPCIDEATVSASVSGVNGGKPPYSYTWSFGGTSNPRTGVPSGTHWVKVKDSRGCEVTRSFTVNVTPPPVINVVDLDDVTQGCWPIGGFDGSIEIEVSGGTPPYTYAWSHGYCAGTGCDELEPGSYTVTVTDAHGCTTTRTFEVTYPDELRYTLETRTLCNGQCLYIATGHGGTPPYRYGWFSESLTTVENTSTTSMAIGPCNVVGSFGMSDAGGCRTSRGPIPSSTGTWGTPTVSVYLYTNCEGNCTVMARALYGVPPYTYIWDDGSTLGRRGATLTDCDGPFSVTVIDAAGCSTTVSGNGSDYTPVYDVSLALNKYLNCDGECVYVAGARTSGNRTVSWSVNGVDVAGTSIIMTGLPCDADVTVTITDDDGCVLTRTIDADEAPSGIPVPAPRLGLRQEYTSTDPCLVKLTVYRYDGTSGEAGWTYAWSTGATTQTVTVPGGSTVTVTVTDEYGCEITETVTAYTCGSEKGALSADVASGPSVLAVVDGSSLAVTINGAPAYPLTVDVVDIRGVRLARRTVDVTALTSRSVVFDVSTVVTGTYAVTVSGPDGRIVATRLVPILR